MTERVIWCSSPLEALGRHAGEIMDATVVVDAQVPACDVVHILGMRDAPLYHGTLTATKAAARRVIHWFREDVRALDEPQLLPEATHVCDSDGLRRDLADRDVTATTVSWPTQDRVVATPLPETPTVAVYFGEPAGAYASAMIAALQAMMPDVPFKTRMRGPAGTQGLQDVIDQSTVLLCITRDNADVTSAKEFMEAGRRAVVTEPLPHGVMVRHDDLLGVVTAVREALEADGLDEAAMTYWRQQNSDERFLEQLSAVW